MDYIREMDVCVEAVRTAGIHILNKHFNSGIRIDSRTKDWGEIVTPADTDSEKIIMDIIKRDFPESVFFSEETSEKAPINSNLLWFIDSLDGTTNAFNLGDYFSVSVALYTNGIAIAGAVYRPVTRELFSAKKGGGAYYDKDGKISKIISPKEKIDLQRNIISTSFQYGNNPEIKLCNLSNEELRRSLKHNHVRIKGSAALDICYVALGNHAVHYQGFLNPYDYAAAGLILQEAGGKLTDIYGNPYIVGQKSILACMNEETYIFMRGVIDRAKLNMEGRIEN